MKLLLHSRMCIVLYGLCLMLCWQRPAFAINIDSLKKIAALNTDDTNKVSVLTTLARYYANQNPREGLQYSTTAVALAEKLNWKPGMAAAYNSLGACFKGTGDYPKALDNYFKSLKISEGDNNKLNIARTLANIGNVYREIKNYPKALEYFGKALETNRALGRKMGMNDNYSDMGIIYSEMNDDAKALDYFDKALKISEEIGDEEGEAIEYGNIANVYSKLKNYDLSIDNFKRSMELNEKLNRRIGMAISYTNLGQLYYEQATDSGVTRKLSPDEKEANLTKAVEFYNKAIPIYIEFSTLDMLADGYAQLSQTQLARKNYKEAFDAYKQYVTLKDSIYSNDNKVKLANLTAERAEVEKKKQEELTRLAQKRSRDEAIFFGTVILLLSVFTVFLVRERRKSERLLLNILPAKVAGELKETGTAAASSFDNVTVLFTDFVNFTHLAETLAPNALVSELHTCFKAFDEIISKYQIEKIKTVGDAYIAVAGLPERDPLHAEHVVKAAIEITAFIAGRRQQLGDKTFEIRVGVHSGSVVAGIVGVKKFAYDIWGDTVNTAARMEQTCEPGKINISQATYDLVRNKFNCVYRGEQEVKNKGALAMYFVTGPNA